MELPVYQSVDTCCCSLCCVLRCRMVLPGHSLTVHCGEAYLVTTVLALLLVVFAPQVDAFVPAGCSRFGAPKLTPSSSSCVKHTRSSQHSTAAACRHEEPVLGTGVRARGGTRRRSTIDDVLVGDDESADRDDDDGGGGGGGGDVGSSKDDIWAGAELPLSNDQQVEQATGALWKALSDGKTRQILRLSLPLIGATEMDDWPGGDRQRYKACGPMVKTLLLGNEVAEGATVVEQILDESDAVGLMQLQCKEAKHDVSVMIFPTTDTLSLQKQVTTGAGSRLVALVNPAWKSVADFGLFGAGEAKKALSEFEVTYSLQSLVVYGYTLRLLYCYPGPWRLFLIGEATGTRELLGSWENNPSNDEVENAVFDKKGRPNAAERVQASAKFFQDGM